MSAYFLERFGIISFLFISITANVNCGQSKSQKTPMSNNQKVPMNDTLKIKGCQEKIKMKVGSIVEIKLEAIPGSGSQWLLKNPSLLLQLLDADCLKFSAPDTKQPTPGQTGHQILHFKAIKKGEEMIQLEYKRTWEKEISNSCQIKIEVN